MQWALVFVMPAYFLSGLTAAHQNAPASRETSRTRYLNRRRVSYGSQLSGSPRAGAPDNRAYATRVRTGGSSIPGFGVEGGGLQVNKDEHGLKFVGTLSDVFGDEMVEVRLGCVLSLVDPAVLSDPPSASIVTRPPIQNQPTMLFEPWGMRQVYLGSFHQQALISEAKRVLSQLRNRGLGVELVAGVAAVGVGRNSIGAVITTSRPYKKVRFTTSCQGQCAFFG